LGAPEQEKVTKKSLLRQYKASFLVIVAVVALLAASPLLQRVLVYPQTDFFTELYLLDSGHMAQNYPYNVTVNTNYNVFLVIANHLGSSADYQVQVKFRNDLGSPPDPINKTPSSNPSLRNIEATVADKETWELPVTFSFDYSLKGANQIVFNSITLNNQPINLNGLTSNFNATTRVFFGDLIFELWKYNSTVNAYQYHERFVDLKFNMTTIGM
jgi:uncharacterized membrane protein